MWNAQNLLALGRFDEALIEIDRALKLDPLSVLMHNVKGTIYYYSRRYDDAVRQFHKTVELDGEGSLWPRLRLAGAYAQKGMFEEAEKHFLKARVIAQPVSELRMAYAYAINGKRREAAKISDRWKRTHSPGYDVAVLHTALGNAATALDILEQIYRDGNANLVYLGVDPRLDPLRAQPRFQELLRKLRLAS